MNRVEIRVTFMKEIFWSLIFVCSLLVHSAQAGRFEDACGELSGSQYDYCVQAEIAADADCVECLMMAQEKPNPWVQVTESLAPVGMILGSTFINAYYGHKNLKRMANSYDLSQKVWSDAFNNGINSCNARFDSYLEYTTTRGAPPVLPEQVAAISECNGVSLQDFAGFRGMAGDGFGGFGNPFGAAGYGPGFLGGMAGPHWGPYGGAGMGAGMGVGLGPGALQAGLGLSVGIPSISIGGGINIGGAPGIYGGAGMGMGGMPGYMGVPGSGIHGGAGLNVPGIHLGGGAGWGGWHSWNAYRRRRWSSRRHSWGYSRW